MKKKVYSVVGLLFLALSFVLVGCSNTSDSADGGLAKIQSESLASSGTLVLKVNPEIAIDYNDRGEVTAIRGLNDDGEEIIGEYADFIGKDSGMVLEELIKKIGDAGYFVEEIEGESKRIVIELEPGSALPSDNFLEVVATNAQRAVQDYKLNSAVTVEDQTLLSLEEAKQIAFDHAKVDGAQAKFDDHELDSDDGVLEYELEFNIGEDEYEYDIHAISGDILDFEHDSERKESKKQPKKEAKKAEYISIDEAKEIAFKHAGVKGTDARFDDQEFDKEDGIPSYELEFAVGKNEYEYDIHAITGKILDFEHDIEQAKKESKPAPKKQAAAPKKEAPAKSKQLSKDEAINVALKHAGLSRSEVSFDDIELDDDDGRRVWEIEFESGNWDFEYDIDANSGKILDSEKEHDD